MLLLLLACCASTPNYSIYPAIDPVNINTKETKWLVDEPTLVAVSNSFKHDAMAYYKEHLSKNFGEVSTVSDLGLPSLKDMVDKDPDVLDLYYDRTKYDYVIETKIHLTRNDINGIQIEKDDSIFNEMTLEIKVYNLRNKELVFKRDYYFSESAKVGLVNADGFVNSCVNGGIKAFGSSYTWNKKTKQSI